MNCLVCSASVADGKVCPSCGYDSGAMGASDPNRILAAREEFKARVTAYAPETRVKSWDKLKPWISVVIGFVVFMLWLRACSTMGWRIW
jgi:hypothetical protein